MGWFSSMILRRRRAVILFFIVSSVLCAFLMTRVRMNYNLADYLPAGSPSTIALRVLEENGSPIPNLQVYLPDTGISEAMEAKSILKAMPHVTSVLWLDDAADIRVPLDMLDADTVSAWYRDGAALLRVTADSSRSVETVTAVRAAFPGCSLAGDLANQAVIRSDNLGELGAIMMFVIPVILVILLLATESWLEPLLFFVAIGAAILINEGTNIFFGEISFITRACSALLQMAVSIDYAVFLLHRFAECKRDGMEGREAMRTAMARSFPAITASALTTVFGFLALVIMDFRIGADMGFVLAKGILLSLACVMTLLPAVAVSCSGLLGRTRHRPFMPGFGGFGRFVLRWCAPLAVIALLMLVPNYMAQSRNAFLYGSSGMVSDGSPAKAEADTIAGKFGGLQEIAVLVPAGDLAREKTLADELAGTAGVTSVISYATRVGIQIPDIMLSEAQLSAFRTDGYSRVILYAEAPDEGDRAFRLVETLREVLDRHYPDGYHLVGQCVVNYDLMKTIRGDDLRVKLTAILSIGLVLLLTFKNALIPLILLVTIEGAVFMNVAMPYFQGQTMNYIGYQIISSVQLGATVDYGILLVQRYLEARGVMDKKAAAIRAVALSTGSILPSAMILTVAGTALAILSSNGIISQLGAVIGRGTAISAGMVLLVLPFLLTILDGIIGKTTFKKRGRSGHAGK